MQHVLVVLNRPSGEAPAHNEGGAAYEQVDPLAPIVSALDLGVSRGDGVFETISVGGGHPQALDHHLRRFAASAAMLELPKPDEQAWRGAIALAVAELGSTGEAWVKIVLTRGIEGDGRPTGWAYAALAPDCAALRTDGISVVTLDRGYRTDVARTSPWLLAGAKTLSYAVNRSVLREAARRGADDVIFVSSDGFVLEGPTSTVVYRRGNGLFTPRTDLGILDGTTQVNLFRFAEANGFETGFELITPDDLKRADAVWLVSSVRLAAPVRRLDITALTVDAELSRRMNDYLLAVRE